MKGAPRLHQESVRIAPGALLDLAARHPGRYPVLLDSAAQGALSQVSLLAALPRGMLWLDSQGRLHQDGALPELPGSGFIESLEAHWQQARAAGASRPPELPFAGGWFVYLGYELALETEPSLRRWWPEASFGDARPVAAALRIPAAILLDADGSGHIVAEQGVAEAELAQLRADLASAGSTAMQTAAEDIAAPAIDLVEEEPAAYLERIRRAQDYIRAGDIYQANLTMPLAGAARGDPVAIYAAILDPGIGELILENPPESHTRPETAEFLGILRTGDLPQNLALLHPRPITFIGKMPAAYEWTKKVYEALGQGDRIRVVASAREWRPRVAE